MSKFYQFLMEFKQLYSLAAAHSENRATAGKIPAVAFVFLKDAAIAGLGWLQDVNVYPIECEPNDPIGHYECHSHGTESAHEPPDEWVALITYDQAQNPTLQRFVQTKELMHIFDTAEGEIGSESDYIGFLNEIELAPPGNRTEAYNSENDAKWKALLCLCPKPTRDQLLKRLNAGEITQYDFALAFRIPEFLISAVISDSYDVALSAYL